MITTIIYYKITCKALLCNLAIISELSKKKNYNITVIKKLLSNNKSEYGSTNNNKTLLKKYLFNFLALKIILIIHVSQNHNFLWNK